MANLRGEWRRRLTLRRRTLLRRSGAALMLAIFVMAVSAALVIAILDTETLQFSSLRHTMDYDRARYMAEAGVQHALAQLAEDIQWRTGVVNVEFPPGSGNAYSATAVDGPNATVVVTASGTAGKFTRRLEVIVKQGG